MKNLKSFRASTRLRRMLVVTVTILMLPVLAQAQSTSWHATLGAQSKDKALQALAFLPNEMWIHVGDSITWTSQADDIHTVTFLIMNANPAMNQIRPPFTFGCAQFPPPPPPPPPTPIYLPSGVSFDGSKCVSSPPFVSGQPAFKVMFTKAGNYKVVCLVHESMTGTIHVLDPGAALPYTQQFYDQQAAAETQALLSDADLPGDHENEGDQNEGNSHKAHARDTGAKSPSGHNSVTVGTGEIVATGGGHQTLSIMRFFSEQIVIHAGETVEWANKDPVTPHTITFGTEPADPTVPSGVSVDADGALHAKISSKSDNVNSGLIVAEGHERIAVPTSPLGITRLRITFTKAGTYPYICALHDDLGMKGTIIVLP